MGENRKALSLDHVHDALSVPAAERRCRISDTLHRHMKAAEAGRHEKLAQTVEPLPNRWLLVST